jgi:hypothetical protein
MQRSMEPDMVAMDELFKSAPENSSPSPVCNRYLQDRAGCFFCSPDAITAVDGDDNTDGSSIKVCNSWWESFQDACKDWNEAFKTDGGFTGMFGSGNDLMAKKPDTLWGKQIQWVDDGCIHEKHEGLPVVFYVLGGFAIVLVLLISVCCIWLDCCGCCGKNKKPKWRRPGMPMGHMGPPAGARPGMRPGGPMRPPPPMPGGPGPGVKGAGKGGYGGPMPSPGQPGLSPYMGPPPNNGPRPVGVHTVHTVTTHTSAAPGPIGVAPVGYSAPPPGAYQGPPPNAGPGIQSAPNPVQRPESGYGVSAPPPPPGMGGAGPTPIGQAGPAIPPAPVGYSVPDGQPAYTAGPPAGYAAPPPAAPGGYDGGKYGGVQ